MEHLYEKISILRKKQLINERYTYGKIGAHKIRQIRGKVGAHVLCFWKLVTEVKWNKMFTHWKHKKDREYKIINIYKFKYWWTFLLTFFLRYNVTWEVIWFKKRM